jgi:PAS domain S-box-containing protein
MTDARGEIVDPAQRWAALTGIDPQNYDSSEWLGYVEPEDRDQGNQIWQAGIAAGRMIEFEQRVRRTDGDLRNYMVRAVPLRDSTGAVQEWIGVDIDVTNQRRAENALRERETFARDVIDSLIAFVGVMTPDGTLITANRAAVAVSGVPESELLNRPLWELHAFSFDEEQQRLIKDSIARAAAGEYVRHDAVARLGDGSKLTIDFAIGAIRGEDGAIRFLVASAVDITERTLIEGLVAASEERYRALVEATSTVVWRTSADGHAFFVGSTWSDLTGQSTDDVAGSGWLEVLHPDDKERVIRKWQAAVAAKSIHEDEFRVRVRDGSYRYFAARGVPVFDEDGSVREWVGANTDIHDRRRAEEALRETADRLSLALEAGQFDTWDWDVQADVLLWTEAAEQRLGAAPNTLAGFIERVHPDDRSTVSEAIRRSLDEQEPYDVEYRTTDIHGQERWLYVRGKAFHDAEGRPIRMLGVDVDVTARKRQEAFEQDFVANVAHDIKNPLAAVKAQTQLLRRRLKSGRADLTTVENTLNVLDSGLSRMNRRIEELADVARLRAGQSLELRIDRCNLATVVTGLIETYQQASERHEIVVSVRSDDLVGEWDSGRIERVVDNLISNAIKYSPDGGTINVTLERVVDDGDWAVLTVSDQGIGIPEFDLPHIFERYRRAGNTAVISGTGIGLAGSRLIVEQHGGSITVESKESVGSTFIVRLPFPADR